MKDKYNNFQIAFSNDNKLIDFYDKYIVNKFDIDFEIVKKIAKQIQVIDKEINGRFGGSIKDLLIVAIVRYISSKSLEIRSNSAHMEVGTLFGGTALLTSFILKELHLEKKMKNIMIDPLAGYYGNQIDFISQLEVTRERLEENLKNFNVKNYEIYQNYSTDTDLINKISDYYIHSFFIDGDHSFSGLLKDWNNFNVFMPVNSYIIIDNVNDKNWPNINIFIQELKSVIEDVWEIVYEENITLVLRKQKDKAVFVNTKVDIETVHKIENQVDEKFYKLLKNRDIRIQTRDEDIQNLKDTIEKQNIRIQTRDEEIESLKDKIQKQAIRIETRDKEIESLKHRNKEQEKKIVVVKKFLGLSFTEKLKNYKKLKGVFL